MRRIQLGCLASAICTLAALVSSSASAQAKVGKPPGKIDPLFFAGGFAPVGETGWTTFLSGIVKDKEGRTVTRTATAHPHYLRQGRRLGSDVVVSYPDLRSNDVVAVFGQLYEVSHVGKAQRPAMHQAMLRWLAEGKLPKGVSVQTDSFIIPLEQDGRGFARLHEASVLVLSIDQGAKPGPTARVQVRRSVPGGYETTQGTVKAGDVVFLHKAGHKVRAVVPRNTKTRVIGWLELDPDPIPEAKLVADKTPFVRPADPRFIAH